MRIFLILFILIITYYNSNCQVRITTKLDEEFTGYVVFETDSFVKINNFNGLEYIVYYKYLLSKDKITSLITLNNDSSFYCHIYAIDTAIIYYLDDIKVKYKISRPEVKSFIIKDKPHPNTCLLTGGTVNIRGGLNFLLGYQMANDLIVRLQFGVLLFVEKSSQINFGINFINTPDFAFGATLGSGFSFNDGDTGHNKEYRNFWYYGGFANVNISIVFIELGLIDDNIDFSSPEMHAQIGLVFRIY